MLRTIRRAALDDYAPAYRLGYNSRSRRGGRFDEAEQNLSREWDATRRFTPHMNEAKHATRAAWDRIDLEFPRSDLRGS